MEDTPTTNEVLKETINGLIKLTDERFSGIKDALVRIEASTQHFVTRTELEEAKKDFNASIKRIEDGFSKHNSDDKDSFGGLDKQMRFLTKAIWMGMGGLAVIVFLLHFLFKF